MSGKKPRRVPSDLKSVQDERLTCRHIQTLVLLQQTTDENEELKRKVQILEKEIMSCQELHQLARDSKKRIQQMKEECSTAVESSLNEMKNSHAREYGKLLDAKNQLAAASSEKQKELEMKISYLESKNMELESQLSNHLMEKRTVESLEEKLEEACSKLSLVKDSKMQTERELASKRKLEDGYNEEKDKYEKKISALEMKAEELSVKLELEVSSKKKLLEQNNLLQQIEKQKCQIEALLKEKQRIEQDFEEISSQTEENKMKMISLQYSNSMLELERDALNQSSIDLKTEVEYLKEREASHKTSCGDFNEYVSIKRELAILKEENLKLKSSRPRTELRTLKSIEPKVKGRPLKSAPDPKKTLQSQIKG
ncbi:golgin subfamily A member 4-like [Rhopilema esculentum]|uniref:golgin subfamily A member 4-like n=1 Tax=Rhopilema esculentum TaxID=499914 RepID=UPI0031D2CC7F